MFSPVICPRPGRPTLVQAAATASQSLRRPSAKAPGRLSQSSSSHGASIASVAQRAQLRHRSGPPRACGAPLGRRSGRRLLDPSLAARLPGALSGGQKQRVCIARALAAEPRLIICDEVTSALDLLVAEGVLKLLSRLQAETGVSYLFITHDFGAVASVADRVAVMKQGALVASGPLAEVFDAPPDPYTAALLEAVPQLSPGWLDEIAARRSLPDTARKDHAV